MLIIYDTARWWSCMMIIDDDHVWWSSMMIIYDDPMMIYIYIYIYMVIIYDEHVRWSYVMIIYDDHRYMVNIYDDHARSSYMTITHDGNVCENVEICFFFKKTGKIFLTKWIDLKNSKLEQIVDGTIIDCWRAIQDSWRSHNRLLTEL